MTDLAAPFVVAAAAAGATRDTSDAAGVRDGSTIISIFMRRSVVGRCRSVGDKYGERWGKKSERFVSRMFGIEH